MSSPRDQDSARVTNRLAGIRRKRGIAAAALARDAGLSRQTIYAMEAGSYVPNTAVALRLARILDVSVEELFSLEEAQPVPAAVRVDLVGEATAGMPLELCRVGGKLVGVPAVPGPSQLLPADGVSLGGRNAQLVGGQPSDLRLLIAGCDPASGILARHLARAGVGLVAAAVNSSAALRLLSKKLTHIAGTHLSGRAPRPPKGTAVFAFARWEQGFVTARGNPLAIHNAADLIRQGLRFANRETGSGSRQLLDRILADAGVPAAKVAGYASAPASGHIEAAWRVYSGLADCCVATRSAALAFGLDFIPLSSERYDLVIPQAYLELAPVQRLLDVLNQSALRRELETVCAYDASETGMQT